eukprot:scaffold9973_cov125-Isochrysis_galbana.AAC.5
MLVEQAPADDARATPLAAGPADTVHSSPTRCRKLTLTLSTVTVTPSFPPRPLTRPSRSLYNYTHHNLHPGAHFHGAQQYPRMAGPLPPTYRSNIAATRQLIRLQAVSLSACQFVRALSIYLSRPPSKGPWTIFATADCAEQFKAKYGEQIVLTFSEIPIEFTITYGEIQAKKGGSSNEQSNARALASALADATTHLVV